MALAAVGSRDPQRRAQLIMEELLQSFHWLRPHWLWLLLPTMVGAIYLLRSARQQNDWDQAIDAELLEALLDNRANARSSRGRQLPVLLAAAGMIIAIIAGAGPSWERLPELPQQRSDTMIIITDLTLSMHATDVKPSRLVRARYKLLELLKQRSEGQTALLAYSGDAHVVTPLTDDARTIAALLPALSPEIMPQIGSNAAAGFALAEQLLAGNTGERPTIVWVTDEVLDDEMDAIASSVARLDGRLVVLGVGSSAGSPIPLPSGKFLKDQYNKVITARLDRKPLQRLARQAGGYYLDLQHDNGDIQFISRLAQSSGRELDEQEASTVASQQFDHWLDRGPYLAVLLLPMMLLAFRRGWLLSLCLLAPLYSADGLAQESPPAQPPAEPASNWQSLWERPDQRAARMLREQRYEEAADTFEPGPWRGVSEYLAGDYAGASQSFGDAATATHALGTADRHYNHGHALARNGQLDEAIAAYDRALALDPGHDNARRAREIVERLKEQQQQQQQNQQQDQQQQGQGDGTQQSNSAEQSSEQEQQASSQASDELESGSGQQQGEPNNEDEPPATADAGQDDQGASESGQAEQLAELQDDPQNQQTEDDAAAMAASAEGPLDEAEQARLQQWLKQIPDDPGGLLRRKFRYEREIRAQNNDVVDRREDGQIW